MTTVLVLTSLGNLESVTHPCPLRVREADRATQLPHLLSSPQQDTDKLEIEDGFRQFGRENRSDFFFFLRGSEHYSLDFKKLEALNSCQSIKNVKRLFT